MFYFDTISEKFNPLMKFAIFIGFLFLISLISRGARCHLRGPGPIKDEICALKWQRLSKTYFMVQWDLSKANSGHKLWNGIMIYGQIIIEKSL